MRKEGLGGIAAPNGPGTPAWGGRGILPRRWSVLKGACRGHQLPPARAHQPGGTGSLAQVVVGAQGGPARGTSSQRPGHTSQAGRGVLRRRWPVLKEGLRGTIVPNGPGTPARGDGESCLGGGQCSRKACGVGNSQRPELTNLGGRGVLPRRWSTLKEGLREAVAPNGMGTPSWGAGSPAQAVVGAQGGLGGDSGSQWPGHTSLGGRGVLPRRWSVLKGACRGHQLPPARAHQPRGTGTPT